MSKSKNLRIFKVRSKATGLFSKGGHGPKWSKEGKTWNNIGHLKNHFRLLLEEYRRANDWQKWSKLGGKLPLSDEEKEYLSQFEIVELEFTIREVKSGSYFDIMK